MMLINEFPSQDSEKSFVLDRNASIDGKIITPISGQMAEERSSADLHRRVHLTANYTSHLNVDRSGLRLRRDDARAAIATSCLRPPHLTQASMQNSVARELPDSLWALILSFTPVSQRFAVVERLSQRFQALNRATPIPRVLVNGSLIHSFLNPVPSSDDPAVAGPAHPSLALPRPPPRLPRSVIAAISLASTLVIQLIIEDRRNVALLRALAAAAASGALPLMCADLAFCLHHAPPPGVPPADIAASCATIASSAPRGVIVRMCTTSGVPYPSARRVRRRGVVVCLNGVPPDALTGGLAAVANDTTLDEVRAGIVTGGVDEDADSDADELAGFVMTGSPNGSAAAPRIGWSGAAAEPTGPAVPDSQPSGSDSGNSDVDTETDSCSCTDSGYCGSGTSDDGASSAADAAPYPRSRAHVRRAAGVGADACSTAGGVDWAVCERGRGCAHCVGGHAGHDTTFAVELQGTSAATPWARGACGPVLPRPSPCRGRRERAGRHPRSVRRPPRRNSNRGAFAAAAAADSAAAAAPAARAGPGPLVRVDGARQVGRDWVCEACGDTLVEVVSISAPTARWAAACGVPSFGPPAQGGGGGGSAGDVGAAPDGPAAVDVAAQGAVSSQASLPGMPGMPNPPAPLVWDGAGAPAGAPAQAPATSAGSPFALPPGDLVPFSGAIHGTDGPAHTVTYTSAGSGYYSAPTAALGDPRSRTPSYGSATTRGDGTGAAAGAVPLSAAAPPLPPAVRSAGPAADRRASTSSSTLSDSDQQSATDARDPLYLRATVTPAAAPAPAQRRPFAGVHPLAASQAPTAHGGISRNPQAGALAGPQARGRWAAAVPPQTTSHSTSDDWDGWEAAAAAATPSTHLVAGTPAAPAAIGEASPHCGCAPLTGPTPAHGGPRWHTSYADMSYDDSGSLGGPASHAASSASDALILTTVPAPRGALQELRDDTPPATMAHGMHSDDARALPTAADRAPRGAPVARAPPTPRTDSDDSDVLGEILLPARGASALDDPPLRGGGTIATVGGCMLRIAEPRTLRPGTSDTRVGTGDAPRANSDERADRAPTIATAPGAGLERYERYIRRPAAAEPKPDIGARAGVTPFSRYAGTRPSSSSTSDSDGSGTDASDRLPLRGGASGSTAGGRHPTASPPRRAARTDPSSPAPTGLRVATGPPAAALAPTTTARIVLSQPSADIRCIPEGPARGPPPPPWAVTTQAPGSDDPARGTVTDPPPVSVPPQAPPQVPMDRAPAPPRDAPPHTTAMSVALTVARVTTVPTTPPVLAPSAAGPAVTTPPYSVPSGAAAVVTARPTTGAPLVSMLPPTASLAALSIEERTQRYAALRQQQVVQAQIQQAYQTQNQSLGTLGTNPPRVGPTSSRTVAPLAAASGPPSETAPPVRVSALTANGFVADATEYLQSRALPLPRAAVLGSGSERATSPGSPGRAAAPHTDGSVTAHRAATTATYAPTTAYDDPSDTSDSDASVSYSAPARGATAAPIAVQGAPEPPPRGTWGGGEVLSVIAPGPPPTRRMRCRACRREFMMPLPADAPPPVPSAAAAATAHSAERSSSSAFASGGYHLRSRVRRAYDSDDSDVADAAPGTGRGAVDFPPPAGAAAGAPADAGSSFASPHACTTCGRAPRGGPARRTSASRPSLGRRHRRRRALPSMLAAGGAPHAPTWPGPGLHAPRIELDRVGLRPHVADAVARIARAGVALRARAMRCSHRGVLQDYRDAVGIALAGRTSGAAMGSTASRIRLASGAPFFSHDNTHLRAVCDAFRQHVLQPILAADFRRIEARLKAESGGVQTAVVAKLLSLAGRRDVRYVRRGVHGRVATSDTAERDTASADRWEGRSPYSVFVDGQVAAGHSLAATGGDDSDEHDGGGAGPTLGSGAPGDGAWMHAPDSAVWCGYLRCDVEAAQGPAGFARHVAQVGAVAAAAGLHAIDRARDYDGRPVGAPRGGAIVGGVRFPHLARQFVCVGAAGAETDASPTDFAAAAAAAGGLRLAVMPDRNRDTAVRRDSVTPLSHARTISPSAHAVSASQLSAASAQGAALGVPVRLEADPSERIRARRDAAVADASVAALALGVHDTSVAGGGGHTGGMPEVHLLWHNAQARSSYFVL